MILFNKNIQFFYRLTSFVLVTAIILLCASACSPSYGTGSSQVWEQSAADETDTSDYIISIEDEPDTVDFQCTTIYYTIAQNVFDRLVEMETDDRGDAVILPALAESWEISGDRRTYTFHLREGVKFSNGSPLTSSDVLYTLTRLLTHPDSCNRDIADTIVGAGHLERGETDRLEGFEILSDRDFKLTLEEPFEAFLACLSMPGASILDAETTEEAGSRFGKDPEWTIGTGSFILKSWEPGKGMLLTANTDCWQGKPGCAGLDLRFVTDSEEIREMFDNGRLDVLDLDEVGKSGEYYLHGDIYQDRLYQVQRIGITYIALNESVEPLNDVRVRKALQLALNRTALLDAAYSGHGILENGILPHGLYGYNPELPEIPCAPEEARSLLKEAGYPDGFSLTITAKASSTLGEMAIVRMTASMWEKIGVSVSIKVINEDEFMRLRKKGSLACYSATWTADYNDPDNFFYTFFGDSENTRDRSLCYPREDIMERVRAARAIEDPEARIREYRELEKIIVQEDAAWIPLFSRLRFYMISGRLKGITSSWNGSVKNKYREMSIR